ncbi:hypothetical protein D3C86_1605260 [compost metagenome]
MGSFGRAWGMSTLTLRTWVSSSCPWLALMRTAPSSMNTSPSTFCTTGQPGWKSRVTSCTLKNRLILRALSGAPWFSEP